MRLLRKRRIGAFDADETVANATSRAFAGSGDITLAPVAARYEGDASLGP